jgi:hypothetical protein
MKSQERREDDAVVIFTGLLLFACLAVVGGVLLAIMHEFSTLRGDVLSGLVYLLLGGAGAVGLHYIYRHRAG